MMSTVESNYTAKSAILALAQQNPDFAEFYSQYQDQIVLSAPLPTDFWDDVITLAERDPSLSSSVRRYRENAQAAQSFAVPGLQEVGILIAALFLLKTHIKIHRTEDGKWDLFVEHEASKDDILEKIVQVLASLFKK